MNIHRTNELLRTATENVVNEERRLTYEDKKGDLDVSDEQEPDYMTQLANDPAYQEFIDNVNQTPF